MPYPLGIPMRAAGMAIAARRRTPGPIERVALADRAAGAPRAAVSVGGDGSTDGGPGARPGLPAGVVLLALLQVAEGAWLLAALGGVSLAAGAGLPAVLLGYGVVGRYAIIVVGALRSGPRSGCSPASGWHGCSSCW